MVFYNYLQVAMGGPREAGTASAIPPGRRGPFRRDGKYQPECLIVWGNRLWDKLPGERWTDGEDIVVDGCRTGHGRLLLGKWQDGEGDAVNHPSVGYSWDYWHRVIANFLK